MAETEIIKPNMTKQWLLSNGFSYNRLFSNEDTEVYTYRFPVYKYESFSILECELRVVLGSKLVYIDVYNHNTINKYAPFYYYEYGEYSMLLNNIWQAIEKEIMKLGIIKKENVRMAKDDKKI